MHSSLDEESPVSVDRHHGSPRCSTLRRRHDERVDLLHHVVDEVPAQCCHRARARTHAHPTRGGTTLLRAPRRDEQWQEPVLGGADLHEGTPDRHAERLAGPRPCQHRPTQVTATALPRGGACAAFVFLLRVAIGASSPWRCNGSRPCVRVRRAQDWRRACGMSPSS